MQKKTQGHYIPLHQIAQESAQRLATAQWGDTGRNYQPGGSSGSFLAPRTITNEFCLLPITWEEVTKVLKKFKRRKAPGPDELPVELLKELTQEGKHQLVLLMNDWWNDEKLPEKANWARVVLIFKKGDTSLCEN